MLKQIEEATMPATDVPSCPVTGLFAATDRRADTPDPRRAALRGAGPLVRVETPAGVPAWVVTEEALARAVLADRRIAKDPAWAPAAWDTERAGLEPTASQQLSLTTLDGPAHTAMRRAHAPLFTPRAVRGYAPRAAALASAALTEAAGDADADGVTDLMARFAPRYPAAVVLDALGVPPEHLEPVVAAHRNWWSGDPVRTGPAMGAFLAAAAAAVDGPARDESAGDGTATPTRAVRLRERMPAGTTRDDLLYALFGMIFAGQLTTEVVLGDLLLAALTDGDHLGDDALVERTLRRRPPVPLTLWRFTTEDVELAGHRLPARSPVLVDLRGLCDDGDADLAFGTGPHFCLGAALARTELSAAVRVLRVEYPDARLAPGARLRRVGAGGEGGDRLAALPVVLDGGPVGSR